MTINRDNLKILRDFLQNNHDIVASKFDMSDYSDIRLEVFDEDGDCFIECPQPNQILEMVESGDDKYSPECGTQFCMVGWCPAIPEFRSVAASSDDFTKLSSDLFGIPSWEDIWDYLFGPDWSSSSKSSLNDAIERLDTVIQITDDEALSVAVSGALEELEKEFNGGCDD